MTDVDRDTCTASKEEIDEFLRRLGDKMAQAQGLALEDGCLVLDTPLGTIRICVD